MSLMALYVRPGQMLTLQDLLSQDMKDFDASLQQKLQRPDGGDLRCAYLLDLLALRVFAGDYERAAAAMHRNHGELGNRSLREAAQTPSGLLEVRRLITQMERRSSRYHGGGAIVSGITERRTRECTLLLDLLPLAWGLQDHEFETLLGIQNSWLQRWRDGEEPIGSALQDRLFRLHRFQETLRQVLQPNEYAAAWRSVWMSGSALGNRSLWEAFLEDGDDALDTVECCFWAVISLSEETPSSLDAALG